MTAYRTLNNYERNANRLYLTFHQEPLNVEQAQALNAAVSKLHDADLLLQRMMIIRSLVEASDKQAFYELRQTLDKIKRLTEVEV